MSLAFQQTWFHQIWSSFAKAVVVSIIPVPASLCLVRVPGVLDPRCQGSPQPLLSDLSGRFGCPGSRPLGARGDPGCSLSSSDQPRCPGSSASSSRPPPGARGWDPRVPNPHAALLPLFVRVPAGFPPGFLEFSGFFSGLFECPDPFCPGARGTTAIFFGGYLYPLLPPPT